jgi:thioredoxin-like negative regulator of GroEL
MIRRPFPAWIKLVAVLVLVLMIISAVRSVDALDARLELARGLSAEDAHQYAAATMHYEEAKKLFPRSVKIDLRLAHTAFAAGQTRRAAEILMSLKDRSLEQADIRDANSLTETIVRSAQPKKTR